MTRGESLLSDVDTSIEFVLGAFMTMSIIFIIILAVILYSMAKNMKIQKSY